MLLKLGILYLDRFTSFCYYLSSKNNLEKFRTLRRSLKNSLFPIHSFEMCFPIYEPKL